MPCLSFCNEVGHVAVTINKRKRLPLPVRGMRVKNHPVWPSFFKYFRQFKKKQRPSTFVTFALRLYNSYNHAHEPGLHMWPTPGPGPDSKCSKTVEVGCSCSKLKPCQLKTATDEIQEKKELLRSNTKSARVSALMGSVPRKMAKWLQRVSAPNGNQTRAARLTSTHLNH